MITKIDFLKDRLIEKRNITNNTTLADCNSNLKIKDKKHYYWSFNFLKFNESKEKLDPMMKLENKELASSKCAMGSLKNLWIYFKKHNIGCKQHLYAIKKNVQINLKNDGWHFFRKMMSLSKILFYYTV